MSRFVRFVNPIRNNAYTIPKYPNKSKNIFCGAQDLQTKNGLDSYGCSCSFKNL